LCDERRLHPVVAASPRRAGVERRLRALQRLQPVPHLPQRRLVESRADLAHVDEAIALVDAQVQRAEPAARALRVGPAAHDELLAQVALDLEPLARAATRVAALGALGDDTLQPLLGRRLVEGLALLGHV